MSAQQSIPVSVTVNGWTVERTVEPRLLPSDFLGHGRGLTGAIPSAAAFAQAVAEMQGRIEMTGIPLSPNRLLEMLNDRV